MAYSFVKDLDAPLLRLSPHDNFTLRDACGGVHAFGGIGWGRLRRPSKCSAERICAPVLAVS